MKYVLALTVACSLSGCGSSDSGESSATGGSGAGGVGGAAGSETGGSAGAATGGGGAAGASGGAAGGGTGPGGAGPLDPTQPGPYASSAVDANVTVAATGHSEPVHCLVPSTGPAPGPYPIVLVAHGFQIAAKQYDGYVARLASHGIAACNVDYPAGFSPNHLSSAKDLVGALDWVASQANEAGTELAGKIDLNAVGIMGHSLGGKLSVLAASLDPRFKAVLGLDPVDSSMLCSPTDCPDASSKLPLPIPTAFLGEVTDSTAGGFGQACAPAADNFQTFFAAAAAPSLEVTLNGANHVSFVDDPATCGVACSFCKPATMKGTDALLVARSYAVAFFARHLRAAPAYDSWLTGSDAQSKFVTPGLVSLVSK